MKTTEVGDIHVTQLLTLAM